MSDTDITLHGRLTAWSCVNAIMRYLGEPEVLSNEFRATAGEALYLDPVKLTHDIREARRLVALKSYNVTLRKNMLFALKGSE